MKKLIIIGASGHGKVVADIAISMKRWEEIVFLDDDNTLQTSMGLEVVGKTVESIKYKNVADFFVAIGNNKIREKIHRELVNNECSVTTLIHPDAVIGSEVRIGTGSAIMAGAIINSSSTIGKGCIINTSSSLDHDSYIEDFVHLSPGVRLAGTVVIGKYCWVGIGAIVINNISICDHTIIGAGGVVVDNITQKGTYIGVPVRRVCS